MLHDFGAETDVEFGGGKWKVGNGPGKISMSPIGKATGQVRLFEIYMSDPMQFRKIVEKGSIQAFATSGVETISF